MGDLYERLRARRAASPAARPARASGGTEGNASERAAGRAGASARPPEGADRSPPGVGWTRAAPFVWERVIAVRLPPFAAVRVGPAGEVTSDVAPLRLGRGDRPLTFDVETSGLSGGAGSVAFLYGFGELTADGCRVRQLFLADFAGEGDLVARVAAIVADAVLVTYNGSSFDLPVVRTRAIMTRTPFEEPRHVDLLHATRRLYRRAIGSCSLGAVERRVLGLTRESDIPGDQVPERYLGWLRGEEGLEPVIDHHLQDVANLAALMDRIAAVSDGRVDDVLADPVALARIALAAGDQRRARAILNRACDETADAYRHVRLRARRIGVPVPVPGELWRRVRRELYALERRHGDAAVRHSLAQELWEATGDPADAIALAKTREHVLGDYRGALDVVEAVMGRVGRTEALERRASRLRRRLGSSRPRDAVE